MLKDKPFWIRNTEEHKKLDLETEGNCCFNHVIGLPTKDGVEKKLFDYQQCIFEVLNPSFENRGKYLWIKKATGLDITEFFLRYMAWLCLRDDTYQNTQMCIVTGPNIDISIKLIRRLKQLFESKLNIVFSTKETVLELNDCMIEAFPSNHLDSMRSLTDVKFIFIDEADFFRIGEQQNVIDVSSNYLAINQSKFLEIIKQMRIAKSRDGKLDKDEFNNSTFDSLDALRLSCCNWKILT